MFSLLAIHSNVIVVSRRKRKAICTFTGSPLRFCARIFSFQRNRFSSAAIRRLAFYSADSRIFQAHYLIPVEGTPPLRYSGYISLGSSKALAASNACEHAEASRPGNHCPHNRARQPNQFAESQHRNRYWK
jgi:hypothetical protein